MSFGTFMGNAKLSVKKHSPEILMVAGAASMVMSIVSAFKARPKYEKVLEEYEEIKNRRQAGIEKAEKIETETGKCIYTEDEKMTDKIADNLRFGMKMATVFGKTVLFGLAAGGCFLGAFKIVNGRYLGAVAVAAGANRKLKAMQAATIAEFGEDAFDQIKERVSSDEMKDHYEEDENNKKIPNEKQPISRFAKWFDELNPNFRDDPEANMNWLLEKQKILNVRLQARGYLFANEIWQELQIPKTESGAIYGILAKNPDGTTNALDLGIFNPNRESARWFVNGYEPVFLIEPNFDDMPIIERVGFDKD